MQQTYTIKQLNWADTSVSSRAYGIDGYYFVSGSEWIYFDPFGAPIIKQWSENPEAGKQAAQEHYENQVKEHLNEL